MKNFNFMRPNLGYQSVLMRGQWFDLHQTAVKTFYRIVLTSRFDELSIFERKQISASNLALHNFIEAEPFTIELPEDLCFHDENLRNKMIRYSGVRHLYLRRIPDRRNRVVVSAFGTLESLHRLRDILSVKPTSNIQADSETRSNMMLRLLKESAEFLAKSWNQRKSECNIGCKMRCKDEEKLSKWQMLQECGLSVFGDLEEKKAALLQLAAASQRLAEKLQPEKFVDFFFISSDPELKNSDQGFKS
ncbi:CBR-RRF-1 protein [Dirofilaria immitis]|nr:CBR-RRF-1 protein [Dirofilaria immitis]